MKTLMAESQSDRTSYTGCGVMTGTSLDGIDLVVANFTPAEDCWNYEIIHAETVKFDPVWVDRLYCLDQQSAETYAKTHVYFGHYLGKEIHQYLERNQLNPDFVAAHGQTIFHQPGKNFTAQIGDGETMASYLNCPLVTNFRNKDVALGGQGAPLVPFGEKFLFPDIQNFLNLGGFANLTVGELAFDVCACNLVLNWLAKQADEKISFDRDGAIAQSGKLDEGLMEALNILEYYHAPPPKSLGREWVEKFIYPLLANYDSSVENLLCTYTHHIALQIGRAFNNTGSDSILITGGGTHNTFLNNLLTENLSSNNISIIRNEDPSLIDFKEALIFAFLGLQTLLGKPNISIAVTGAKSPSVSGSIHLPAAGGYSLFN